jgi:hypothetical protein
MPTTVLNLTDLDNRIRGYEQKYAVSSVDMLKEKSVRDHIPEDDILRWETYVYQRVRLRDIYDRLRGDYLSKLPQGDSASDSVRNPANQLDLVA